MVATIFAAFSQRYISTEIYRSEKRNHLFLLRVLREGEKKKKKVLFKSSIFFFFKTRAFFSSYFLINCAPKLPATTEMRSQPLISLRLGRRSCTSFREEMLLTVVFPPLQRHAGHLVYFCYSTYKACRIVHI